MENNLKDFPSDFVKPFILAFKEFDRAGIDIFQNSYKWIERLRSIFIAIFITALGISLNAYFSRVFMGKMDIFELSYVVPIYLVSQFAIIKGIFTLVKKSDMREIIFEISSMWRSENLTEEQVKRKNDILKRLNLYQQIYLWSYWLGIYQYMFGPIIEELYRTFVLQREFEFSLPFSCSYPYDPRQNWTIYVLTYLFEILSMIRLMSLYTAYDTLFITLCSHLGTEFIILQEDLRHTETVLNNIQEADDKDVRQPPPNIKIIMKRHNKLIEISNKLDGIYNIMIFMNLLVVSIMAGFFGLACRILISRPIDFSRNAAGIPCSLLPIFYFSYYGEFISGASAELGDCAFKTLWYNSNLRYKQAVLFIIMRSQKLCRLTILGYAPISLNTFTRVLSTTWSYFSLVTSMYERGNK